MKGGQLSMYCIVTCNDIVKAQGTCNMQVVDKKCSKRK